MKKQQLTLFTLIVIIVFISCSESAVNFSDELGSEKNLVTTKIPLSEQSLEKFSDFKDRKYYKNLEDLAYVLATQQQEYSHIMRESMKKSKVKEGILNLTKGNTIDKTNNLVGLVKNKIGRAYTQKAKLKSNKLSVEQLLGKLSRDINIYFPIVEHRKNVLDNGENYWVAFNPPDHDESEYFVRAFNQFGEDSLISSKNAPKENILVVSYSEKQELFSPDLTRIIPIDDDCIHIESLVVMPCLPGNPDPDPNPITYEKGLNLTSIRTKGINDGWLDGDLELYFKIEQPAFSGYFNLPIVGNTPFNINVSTFIEASKNHDAGHWGGLFGQIWRDSNKKTYINARRRASERFLLMEIPLVGKVYYDEFKIRIEEIDPLFNDVLLEGTSFNLKTQTFGVEWNIKNDRIWIQLDYKDYPTNSF